MGGQGRWCGMCRGGLVWGFVPGGDNSNNTQSNTINTPMINLLSAPFLNQLIFIMPPLSTVVYMPTYTLPIGHSQNSQSFPLSR